MWCRLQMLLRPKWLIRLKQKKGGRGSEGGRNWKLQGPRKAKRSASESGAWLLLSCPTRDGGSWSSLKRPAAWSWQMRELLWTSVSSSVRQGWDCLLLRPSYWRGNEMFYARFSLPDCAQRGFPAEMTHVWIFSACTSSQSRLSRLCLASSVKPADWFALGQVTGVHACVWVCVCGPLHACEQRCALAYLMPERELWLPVAKSLVKKCSQNVNFSFLKKF